MMKVLCDVHIAFKIVRFFESNDIEAVHVNDILDGDTSTDQDICAYADEYEYTVISKDSDFKNSHFIENTPARLIKVNLGNLSTRQLISILETHLDWIVELFESKPRCIEIYTDRIEVHET